MSDIGPQSAAGFRYVIGGVQRSPQPRLALSREQPASKADAIYNSSRYHDFATGGESTKTGFYFLGTGTTGRFELGARGWHIGVSAMSKAAAIPINQASSTYSRKATRRTF
jgi:hypothetical protein